MPYYGKFFEEISDAVRVNTALGIRFSRQVNAILIKSVWKPQPNVLPVRIISPVAQLSRKERRLKGIIHWSKSIDEALKLNPDLIWSKLI